MFLKFEELRTEPREHLLDVFRFILCQKDLAGTYVEHRIDELIRMGPEATRSYKLKNTDGRMGHAIDRYPHALQEHIKTELSDYCQFFGYFKTETNPDTSFQLFDPPQGWEPKPDLGYYKQATKEAVDFVDDTSIE